MIPRPNKKDGVPRELGTPKRIYLVLPTGADGALAGAEGVCLLLLGTVGLAAPQPHAST